MLTPEERAHIMKIIGFRPRQNDDPRGYEWIQPFTGDKLVGLPKFDQDVEADHIILGFMRTADAMHKHWNPFCAALKGGKETYMVGDYAAALLSLNL